MKSNNQNDLDEFKRALTMAMRSISKEDELIQIPDVKIATCTQWGISDIKGFIKHVDTTLSEEYAIQRV